MGLFVTITDGDWFNYLSAAAPLDEGNFWQPVAMWNSKLFSLASHVSIDFVSVHLHVRSENPKSLSK
jgi:hypothetical protein